MSQNIYVTDDRNLYLLDCATGSFNTIGVTGGVTMVDIAMQGCEGLWGSDFSNLYAVDPRNAAITLIGPHGGGFFVNAMDVARNGILYGGTTAGQLITIDTTTGAGALVGNYGPGITSSGDIAFDTNDVLYATVIAGGVDQLATIDRNTGAATLIGPIGFKDVWSLDFYCCHLFGGTSDGRFLVINPFTGAGTQIGANGLVMRGFAASNCCGC